MIELVGQLIDVYDTKKYHTTQASLSRDLLQTLISASQNTVRVPFFFPKA